MFYQGPKILMFMGPCIIRIF